MTFAEWALTDITFELTINEVRISSFPCSGNETSRLRLNANNVTFTTFPFF